MPVNLGLSRDSHGVRIVQLFSNHGAGASVSLYKEIRWLRVVNNNKKLQLVYIKCLRNGKNYISSYYGHGTVLRPRTRGNTTKW